MRTPCLAGLEAFALGQGSYFDRRDARDYGITDPLLGYHTRTGRFEHVLPGVYRLRAAPMSPYDEYLLAWVWTNYRGAISHESALALYDLADILPARVHVTVPRPFHRTSAPFKVHLSGSQSPNLVTPRKGTMLAAHHYSQPPRHLALNARPLHEHIR